MKIIIIYVESGFRVIPYLTWKWLEIVIFFCLTFISLLMIIYTFLT